MNLREQTVKRMTPMWNEMTGRSRWMMTSVVLAMLSLTVAGCGEDSKAQEPAPGPTCKAGVLEADLEMQPMSGPGVDPATGTIPPPPSGSSYVISSTYGAPKPEGAVMERYKKLFGAIEAQMKSQQGLLALQLSQSSSCGSGRTLAVWASEEAMYEFVSSQAHMDAVAAAGEVLQPGYAVTHWEAKTAEQMGIEEGVRQLAAEGAK